MTTPLNRRRFLATIAGLAVAPFIAARALAAAKAAPVNPPIRDSLNRAKPLDNHCAYPGRAIKVPSNRFSYCGWAGNPRDPDCPRVITHFYHGDWDGTFKLEVCDNPAYVLADLWEQQGNLGRFGSGKGFDWHALYDWGVYCDELVCRGINGRVGHEPRLTVPHLLDLDDAHGEDLREALSMRFKVWLATDPRYQRSFPGIPLST